MIKKTHKLLCYIFAVLSLLYASSGLNPALIEEVSLPMGSSWDIDDTNGIVYKHSLLLYAPKDGTTTKTDFLISTESLTPSLSRESRNHKLNKRVQSGVVRVYIFSEKLARYDLEPILDFTLITPRINDLVLVAISKGNSAEILDYDDNKNINAPEYIEGLIRTAPEYNFFPKNFTIIDIFLKSTAEGTCITLPYVEIGKEGLEISGLALFKGTKMIAKTNMYEAKYINLLKHTKVKGILSLQKGPNEYIDFLATSKRKVKCIKYNDKYKLTIELSLKGDFVSNTIYDNLFANPTQIKEFQKDLEAQLKKDCLATIKKIQKEYSTDILDLGNYAAAKYGRDTGVDWDKIISNSDIDVNIEVKVTKQGRGDFKK